MKKTILFFCSIFIFNSQLVAEHTKLSVLNCNTQVYASRTDTIQFKKHDPKKASWLALIPGAGQIYNKKYWKLPTVYGGLGASGFLVYYYANRAIPLTKEYVARINGEIENLNPDWADISNETILNDRNYNRRNMEISIAAFAIVYALSVLDACVDAHLYYYDVSDDLSIGVKPKLDYTPFYGTITPSLALVIKF